MDSVHEVIALDNRRNPDELQIVDIQQSGTEDIRREVPDSIIDRCGTVSEQICRLMVPGEQNEGKMCTQILAFRSLN